MAVTRKPRAPRAKTSPSQTANPEHITVKPRADIPSPYGAPTNGDTFQGYYGRGYQPPYRDAGFSGGSAPKFSIMVNGLSSGNKDIIKSRRQAVINARDIDRNNAMIHSGITKRARAIVGSNLMLQSTPAYEALGLSAEWADEFSQQFEREFALWGQGTRFLCDAERHQPFGAMMFQMARNAYGADGECGAIIRFSPERMATYGARYRSFVEVIDTDRISNPNNAPDTDLLCQGRILDQWGGMTGIHVEVRHPSDRTGVPRWEPVPRESAKGRPIAIHWFPKNRAQVQRGMPSIIAGIRNIRGLERFDENTLKQAAMAAWLSMYIKTDANSAEALAKLQQQTPSGANSWEALQEMRFGLYDNMLAQDGSPLPVLAQGDDIGIAQSTHAANDQTSFRYAYERITASLLGLSYANSSNDYSKTSFASIRAEFIDMWRLIVADRDDFTQAVPAQIAMALLEELIAYEVITLPPGAPEFYANIEAYAACIFRGPGMGWVDPVKDAQAAGMRISSGFSSPQKEAAAAGEDWRDIADQTALAQAYYRKKGVKIAYGAITQQDRNDATIGADGQPIDPNAPPGSGGTGSSDPPPGAAPAPTPAAPPKPKPAPAKKD